MKIGVLGINHRSAPLFIREKIAELCSRSSNKIILNTCHRTEIYFSNDDLAEVQNEIFQDLKTRIPHAYEHAFYSYFGKECFYHLACVTAGLDSAMLAETDVQRQVKIAYETTRIRYSLSAPLHFLFQKSLMLGKKVRSSYSLFQTTLHLEGLIFQIVQKFQPESLLFIGNSDINRKIIHTFWRRGVKNMTLVTRNLENTTSFSLDYALTLKDYSEIQNWSQYDVIIAATPSEKYLITSMPFSFKTRLILDLSVPRSVHPSLKKHPQLLLLNMEEIGRFFESHHTHHIEEVQNVKSFLQKRVDQYAALYEAKSLSVF